MQVLEEYMEAWNFLPSRAEPLYEIARHYFTENKLPMCGFYASRAYKVPYPDTSALFVQKINYDKDIPELAGICGW